MIVQKSDGLALSFTAATLNPQARRHGVICSSFRGSFEVSQPIQGPLPDTWRAQVDANGVLTMDGIGRAATWFCSHEPRQQRPHQALLSEASVRSS